MPWRVETPMSQRQDWVEVWAKLAGRAPRARSHRTRRLGAENARSNDARGAPVLIPHQTGADPAPAESPR